jgi:glycosyltransferase involved in cell wall biosynthesis
MVQARQISIVVPAFNEEEAIGAVVENLLRNQPGAEVLVVDDGSTDGTAEVARSGGATVIRHPYNKGYGAALKTGIERASGEFVVLVDADGQHDSADLELLVREAENHDMVVGARDLRTHSTFFRRPGKALLGSVANYLAGTKIPDLNSGFRLVRRERVLEFFHILPNGFSFTTTLTLAFLTAAHNVKYVPVRTRSRQGGSSSVGFFRDAAKAFLLVIRTIVLFNPLKVFVPASLFLGLFGLAFTIFGIVAYGRAPNTGILIILTGVIVFFFGILADQISAMRRERAAK